MQFEVQTKNLAAVEGYNATFISASYLFNSLSTPAIYCFLFSDRTGLLYAYRRFNPDCECWLDNQTICYHDANSSSNADECCRYIVTLHILPHVDETLDFTCLWRHEYLTYNVFYAAIMDLYASTSCK